MNDKQTVLPRRSTGIRRVAHAVWYVRPGVAEMRTSQIVPPRDGQALVKTLFTGISRGTERLVLSGAVPEAEWPRMRAPMQEGEFPFPVKYGYCAVGRVEAGPPALLGETVFCLHPHQDWFLAPVSMLVPIPQGLPARRATLAANMETALNALWDSGAGPADRIVVVGAGVIGLLIAYLAARLPGAEVCVIDIAAERCALVETLGARFQCGGAGEGADVVFHTSVTPQGTRGRDRVGGPGGHRRRALLVRRARSARPARRRFPQPAPAPSILAGWTRLTGSPPALGLPAADRGGAPPVGRRPARRSGRSGDRL